MLLGEDEPLNYNAYQFLQSCPEDYFFDYSKFHLFFDKATGKGNVTLFIDKHKIFCNQNLFIVLIFIIIYILYLKIIRCGQHMTISSKSICKWPICKFWGFEDIQNEL